MLKNIVMGLIGSVFGGAASIAGGIMGGKAARKGYNQAIKMYEDRMKDIKAHRDAVYYQDPTQSAENQAAVTQAREVLAENTKQAAAKAAITGGTDESVARAKQAAAATVGDMMHTQAVQGAAKKEGVWASADDQLNTMTKYLADVKMQKGLNKAQNITAAANGLSEAVGGIDFDGTLGKTGIPL